PGPQPARSTAGAPAGTAADRDPFGFRRRSGPTAALRQRGPRAGAGADGAASVPGRLRRRARPRPRAPVPAEQQPPEHDQQDHGPRDRPRVDARRARLRGFVTGSGDRDRRELDVGAEADPRPDAVELLVEGRVVAGEELLDVVELARRDGPPDEV